MATPKAHEMHDRQAEKTAGKPASPDKASHEIADQADDAEPKGRPKSDRFETETATKKD